MKTLLTENQKRALLALPDASRRVLNDMAVCDGYAGGLGSNAAQNAIVAAKLADFVFPRAWPSVAPNLALTTTGSRIVAKIRRATGGKLLNLMAFYAALRGETDEDE